MKQNKLKDSPIYKELENDIKSQSYVLNKSAVLKKLLDSGGYKIECLKSFDGYHQWRTMKADNNSHYYETLPYCYYCELVDKTNTEKRTPIVGDRDWKSRGIRLIKTK